MYRSRQNIMLKISIITYNGKHHKKTDQKEKYLICLFIQHIFKHENTQTKEEEEETHPELRRKSKFKCQSLRASFYTHPDISSQGYLNAAFLTRTNSQNMSLWAAQSVPEVKGFLKRSELWTYCSNQTGEGRHKRKSRWTYQVCVMHVPGVFPTGFVSKS